jgi:hypothetical protein
LDENIELLVANPIQFLHALFDVLHVLRHIVFEIAAGCVDQVDHIFLHSDGEAFAFGDPETQVGGSQEKGGRLLDVE